MAAWGVVQWLLNSLEKRKKRGAGQKPALSRPVAWSGWDHVEPWQVLTIIPPLEASSRGLKAAPIAFVACLEHSVSWPRHAKHPENPLILSSHSPDVQKACRCSGLAASYMVWAVNTGRFDSEKFSPARPVQQLIFPHILKLGGSQPTYDLVIVCPT